jgi:serine/threonine-protein kinase
VPGSPAAKTGAATTSLVDDDEDIPTTVATREHIKDLGSVPGLPGPPPMLGSAGQRPIPPPPAAGNAAAMQSMRQTNLGLGNTIALPPSMNPLASGPPGPQPGPPPAPPPGSGPMIGPSGPTSHGPPMSPRGAAGGPMSGPFQPHGAPTFGAPPSGPPGLHPQSGAMHPMSPPAGMSPPASSQPGYFGGPPGGAVGHHSMQPPQHGPHGAPLGPNPGADAAAARANLLKPSQIETALSIPRPDPQAMWMAQQASAVRSNHDKNTAVLIAVAILTAICVLALCALLYFKARARAATPPPAPSGAITAIERTPAA